MGSVLTILLAKRARLFTKAGSRELEESLFNGAVSSFFPSLCSSLAPLEKCCWGVFGFSGSDETLDAAVNVEA